MSGEVGHLDIPADNLERARKFYLTAFGWKLREMPEMEYTMVSTGPVDENGRPKTPASSEEGSSSAASSSTRQ